MEIESRESVNLLTRKGMLGVARSFGIFLYWCCISVQNFLTDPHFHGYLSSVAQKLIQGKATCGGPQKKSPIPSFMATSINGLICGSQAPTVAGASCWWAC